MATMRPLKRKKGEAYLISFTHPKNRRYVRKVVYCSLSEAKKILKRVESDLAFGQFNIDVVSSAQTKWSELVKKYLAKSSRNKSPNTVNREETALKAFTGYLNSNIPITEIQMETIEQYKAARLSAGLSPATVSIELRILKTMFNQAVQWELMDENPVRGVGLPKANDTTVRFLRKDEISALLSTIKTSGELRFHRLVLAYLYTGARRSELLPPRFGWDNVDFLERTITINGKGSKRRTIHINDALLKILTDIQAEGNHVPFDLKPDHVSHKIKEFLLRAGIANANVHSLRKTFGSTLLQSGLADLYTVSRLLGHSSIRTTEKYYVDLLDKNLREPVQGLDQIIK